MGLTHYWRWLTAPEPARLVSCLVDMHRVAEAFNEDLEVELGTGGEVLRLNGVEGEGCEDFLFPWDPGRPVVGTQQFCKTDAQPYDAVVTACLVVARDHFDREELQIRSDVDWVWWRPGAELYSAVLGRSALDPR